jgi:hypothetical protein
MRFLVIFSSLFCILISGCKGMTVKYVNPDEPNAFESNERVVIGRVIFNAHFEETGIVSFTPLGLGLVQVETGDRPTWPPVVLKKVIVLEGPEMHEQETYMPSYHSWFENDGTFFWILKTGSYRIDALGWGYTRGLLGSDPKPGSDLKGHHPYAVLKPGKPPECGFLITPDATFTVSGDSNALYIGTLFIDMDIVRDKGIAVSKVHSVEVRDDFTEAVGSLKSLYPQFTLPVNKRLMSVKGLPVNVEKGRCPSRTEVLFRKLLESFPGGLGGNFPDL